MNSIYSIDEMGKSELENCSFVKTVLMLIIVLYHSILFWGGNWFGAVEPMFIATPLVIAARYLNSFHIYGFTLVSGYIFYYIKYEKSGYQKFLPFINNKTKRLLIPYVFVSAIWVIPISGLFFGYTVSDTMKDFVLGMNPSQLWFLLMLFDVFVIFWVLSDLIKNHEVTGIILAVVFYGIGIVIGRFIPNVFMIVTACKYVPLFFVGFKMRQYANIFLKRIPICLWVAADIVLFAFKEIIFSENNIIFRILNLMLDFALHIVGAIMIFLLLQKIASNIKWNNRYFKFLSERSMVVYLFHQQIIYIVIYLFNGLINPYFHAAINFVLSLGVSLIISTVLLRFKATRFLIGEK